MAASVESRVPFLTPALANFLLALPAEYLLSDDGVSKHVFREAMRGLVPDQILDRRDKIGFATPEKKWLTALRPWVDRLLTPDRASVASHPLDFDIVRCQWNNILAGRKPWSASTWRWLNLIEWGQQYNIGFEL